MATMQEIIQAQIQAVKDKAAADVAALEAHLHAGESWLQQEATTIEDWLAAEAAKIRSLI